MPSLKLQHGYVVVVNGHPYQMTLTNAVAPANGKASDSAVFRAIFDNGAKKLTVVATSSGMYRQDAASQDKMDDGAVKALPVSRIDTVSVYVVKVADGTSAQIRGMVEGRKNALPTWKAKRTKIRGFAYDLASNAGAVITSVKGNSVEESTLSASPVSFGDIFGGKADVKAEEGAEVELLAEVSA